MIFSPPPMSRILARGEDGFACEWRGLRIIASWGYGWEHVSVSTTSRCPTWDEMCAVKDALFMPEECVVQFHPPQSEYVNWHPYCLHLWRPTAATIPTPPTWMLGPRRDEKMVDALNAADAAAP